MKRTFKKLFATVLTIAMMFNTLGVVALEAEIKAHVTITEEETDFDGIKKLVFSVETSDVVFGTNVVLSYDKAAVAPVNASNGEDLTITDRNLKKSFVYYADEDYEFTGTKILFFDGEDRVTLAAGSYCEPDEDYPGVDASEGMDFLEFYFRVIDKSKLSEDTFKIETSGEGFEAINQLSGMKINDDIVYKNKTDDNLVIDSFTFTNAPFVSNDATLSALSYSVSGATAVSVENFAADKLSYVVDIVEGTANVKVTAACNDAFASAVVTDADLSADVKKATIVVTAEDGTTKTYEITFNIVIPEIKVSANANNGTIIAKINGMEAEWEGVHDSSYPRGTTIELTAISLNAEDYEFLYWKDNTTGRIVTDKEKFEFVVGTEKNYTAIFADRTNGKAYIVFRSNGKILSAGYVGDEVIVPEVPYIAGHKFNGWYKNAVEKVETPALDVDEDTTYYAGFVVEETTYEVKINGVGAMYKYNDKVEANAELTNGEQVFVYWTRDGKIVSYEPKYVFYANRETKLEAVYASVAVEKKAVVTIAEPIVMKADGKLAFYAERDIPEDCTIVETGIILNKAADFDVNTAEIRAVARYTTNKGQYTIRKANVEAGDTWYARAYVIYADADGDIKTIYSEEVSKTFPEE